MSAYGKPKPSTCKQPFFRAAAAGDVLQLHTFLERCVLQLQKIADEIEADIEPEPTQWPAGSPEKIEVMAARLAAGEKVFSDGDGQGR